METYDQWIRFGQEQGWVGPAVCYTHDGLPTTRYEDKEFDNGDPCIFILRPYESKKLRMLLKKTIHHQFGASKTELFGCWCLRNKLT